MKPQDRIYLLVNMYDTLAKYPRPSDDRSRVLAKIEIAMEKATEELTAAPTEPKPNDDIPF